MAVTVGHFRLVEFLATFSPLCSRKGAFHDLYNLFKSKTRSVSKSRTGTYLNIYLNLWVSGLQGHLSGYTYEAQVNLLWMPHSHASLGALRAQISIQSFSVRLGLRVRQVCV